MPNNPDDLSVLTKNARTNIYLADTTMLSLKVIIESDEYPRNHSAMVDRVRQDLENTCAAVADLTAASFSENVNNWIDVKAVIHDFQDILNSHKSYVYSVQAHNKNYKITPNGIDTIAAALDKASCQADDMLFSAFKLSLSVTDTEEDVRPLIWWGYEKGYLDKQPENDDRVIFGQCLAVFGHHVFVESGTDGSIVPVRLFDDEWLSLPGDDSLMRGKLVSYRPEKFGFHSYVEPEIMASDCRYRVDRYLNEQQYSREYTEIMASFQPEIDYLTAVADYIENALQGPSVSKTNKMCPA